METTKNLSFESLPEAIGLKLQQLIKELPIENVFFHPATATAPPHLIINAIEGQHMDVIESRKWLRLAVKERQVLFHVLGSRQIRFAYKNGNPFIPSYCTKSGLLYQNPDFTTQLPTTWKSFKGRFKKYEHEYFHQHDLLMTLANQFYGLEARTSVFLTYISIFEHHLTYLENLYIGHRFFNTPTQRIKYLAQYIPFIEDLFVKQNGETYYLLVQLEKAKEAAAEADEMYINWELYTAIRQVEKQLYAMVANRLLELKKRIKSNKANELTLVSIPEKTEQEKEISQIVSQIIKIKQPEEIFLFHKTQTASKTNYYLLLIGKGLGTETLNSMQQSVMAAFNGSCSVVLIGHSRIWIQQNLFIHQDFFKNIMTSENKVFSLKNKEFTMHWQHPYTPSYGDLDYMYKATDKMISNYFVLREWAEKENGEGVYELFSNAILRFFRTFVFAKLSYQPHYLSANNLWMLCLYAQPNLGKIAYLFEKLSGDAFFKEVDYNSRFNHGLSRIPEEKGLVMDEILNVLGEELKVVLDC